MSKQDDSTESGVIRPCPFCGAEARIGKRHGDVVIRCSNPHCDVKPSVSKMANTTWHDEEQWWTYDWRSAKNRAVKAWNTRI